MHTKNRFENIPHEISLVNLDAFYQSMTRYKRIVIDMGCGHGDFLIDQAPKSEETLFIGIEISRKRLFKTTTRLQKRGIHNYALLHGPGDSVLKQMVKNECVDEINVNFPDPWLSEKQWKTRILKPSFLIDVLRILKKGGILNFVTDVDDYAHYAKFILSQMIGFKNRYQTDYIENLYERFPTLFFNKMSPLRTIKYFSREKL